MGQINEPEVPPNKSLQPTVIPLRGLPAAELTRHFDAVFGASWMVGSLLMGWLYGLSPDYLVIFAVAFEILSIFPFLRLHRAWKTA